VFLQGVAVAQRLLRLLGVVLLHQLLVRPRKRRRRRKNQRYVKDHGVGPVKECGWGHLNIGLCIFYSSNLSKLLCGTNCEEVPLPAGPHVVSLKSLVSLFAFFLVVFANSALMVFCWQKQPKRTRRGKFHILHADMCASVEALPFSARHPFAHQIFMLSQNSGFKN
jgi:hypothetical protein